VCVFHVFHRRLHPYKGHQKLNSVRPLNCELQADRRATDEVTFVGDVENERIVNKVEPGRRQGLSALCKASAVNTDRSSKWSKFLSNDVMNDGEVISSHLVSDSVDDD